jgi:hypothetical protein
MSANNAQLREYGKARMRAATKGKTATNTRRHRFRPCLKCPPFMCQLIVMRKNKLTPSKKVLYNIFY